jgi:hypothetical protein
MKILLKLLIALAIGILPFSQVYAGPISTWYVNSSNLPVIHAIQGNSITTIATGTMNAFPIAVTDTIRTIGSTSGFVGREYSLSGSVTPGVTYSYLGSGSYWDATSDSIHNYLYNFATGQVVQTGLQWQSPVTLFSVTNTGSDYLGIAYDLVTNSLWLSGWDLNKFLNVSLTGQILGSFTGPSNNNRAFGIDPADNTLWVLDAGGNATQLSKTGQVLSTDSYTGPNNALGGDFAAPFAVPGPIAGAGLPGLTLAMATFIAWRRRRRASAAPAARLLPSVRCA